MTIEPQIQTELNNLRDAATGVQLAYEATLEALQTAHKAELNKVNALKVGFRNEADAWRKLAGVTQPFTEFLTPAEVATKKL